MGDRTYCSFRIHKDNFAKMKAHLGISDDDKVAEHFNAQGTDLDEEGVAKIYDDQANYGAIEKLSDYLSEHGIEYDKRWESGGDYSAGDEYFRVIDGKHCCYDLYEGQFDTSVVLKQLLQKAAEGEDLKTLVEAKYNEIVPFEPGPLRPPSNSKNFITEE